MTLLNRLFGNKKKLIGEIQGDYQRRIHLWNEFLSNYSQIEEASKFFSYKNIDMALKNPSQLHNTLDKIESLVSRDIFNLESENDSEKDLLRDLESIITGSKMYSFSKLTSIVKRQKKVEEDLNKLHDYLTTMMQSIKYAKRKLDAGQDVNKDLMLNLFRVVFHQIPFILQEFKNAEGLDRIDLDRIMKAVLAGEKLTETVQSAEETFTRIAIGKMKGGSSHKYRRLAERVYYEILEKAGAPFREPEYLLEGISRIERMVNDERYVSSLIVKNKGRLKMVGDEHLWLARAFKQAYHENNFENLDSEI